MTPQESQLRFFQQSSRLNQLIWILGTICAIALPKIIEIVDKDILQLIPSQLLWLLFVLTITAFLLQVSYNKHLLHRLESRYIIKFGIKWDKENELAPICPTCDKPLSEWGLHELKESELMSDLKHGFKYFTCDTVVSLKDENDDVGERFIFPRVAKRYIKRYILT